MNKFYSPFLRDEQTDGDGAGGGDGGAAVADAGEQDVDTSSYLTDAEAALSADKSAEQGDKSKSADGAAKPAGEKSQPAAKAKETPKEEPSEFEKIAGKVTGKKPEVKPADGQQPPAEHPEDKLQLGPKAGTETVRQFGELKTITKTLRSDLAARDAELATLKKSGTGAPPPELEKLREENKLLSDRLAVVDLKSHPKFQQDFVVPRAKAAEGLATILKENGIEGVDVAALVSGPRAKLNELAAKLPELDRAEFAAGIRQIRALSEAEAAAVNNAAEASKNLGSMRATMQKAVFDESWKTMGDRVGFEPLQAGDNATPEDKAAIDAYNAGIAEIRSTAERLAFKPANEQEVATAATQAAAYQFLVKHAFPRLEAEYSRAVKLIREQHSELQALRGSKAEAGAVDGGASEGTSDQGDMDYAVMANAAVGKR